MFLGRSDGAIKNPNIRESSLFVTGNSRFYTKTKRDESTDSGVVEDIPGITQKLF